MDGNAVQSSGASFLSLPTDVLSIVANSLPLTTILKATATCKELKSCFLPWIRKVDAFISQSHSNKDQSQYIASFDGLCECTSLTELFLDLDERIDKLFVFDALKHLPKLTNLRSLRVPLCTAVPAAHIRSIFSLRHLTRLELSNFYNPSSEMDSAEFMSTTLSSLAKLTQLRHLNLGKLHISGSISESQIVCYLLPLEKLEFLWIPSSLKCWDLLAPLSSLQTLVVCDYDSSQSIRYLSICDALHQYELTMFFNVLVPKLRAISANVIASFTSPHNGAESQWSFVGAAARAPTPVMLKWMLEENADIASFHVEAKDLKGYTPLMHVRGHDVARYLISTGANVNALAVGPDPNDPNVRSLTLLSTLTRTAPNNPIANMLIFRVLSEVPALDYNLGEPRPLILALRYRSLLLKAMIKARPKYLAQQPFWFIRQCREECRTEGQWQVLQSVLPEPIVAQLNAEFGDKYT